MWFLSWLRGRDRSRAGGRPATPRSPRKRASSRPRLQALEDRCLPSGFGAPVSYPVGTGPQAVITADLNGDGKPDLITANLGTWNATTGSYVGGGVSVLLALSGKNGSATGTFGAAQNYAVGSATAVAVGDINGDGKADIVTANGGVLLGNGKGTFTIGPSYAGGGGSFVAVADLNGDGRRDLLTATYGSGITFLPGNGDGTFGAGTTYMLPNLTAVATGDFNRDGKLDVVAAVSTTTGYTLSLLPGNGDGTFGPAQAITSGWQSSLQGNLVVADFNADGQLDLAYADYFYGPGTGSPVGAHVLLGDGHGGFVASGGGNLSMLQPTMVVGLAAGDFNHDGKLDLLAVGSGWAEVLSGKGDGTFGLAYAYNTYTTGATAMAVGDVNGDGYSDLVLVGVDPNGSSFLHLLLWSSKNR